VNRYTITLSCVLLGQAALFYGLPSSEVTPTGPPLSALPVELGAWASVRETPIDAEVQEVLKADDSLNRVYANAQLGAYADLFVAYFRSQRTGKTPHTPKHCMPGSGWDPVRSDIMDMPVPGSGSIRVNRYILRKGAAKTVVLYWYQTSDRVIASEYWAKIYTVLDALRHRRTDTALVRVVVQLGEKQDEEEAVRKASNFAQTLYPALRPHIPI
jgi:EpsI family protein